MLAAAALLWIGDEPDSRPGVRAAGDAVPLRWADLEPDDRVRALRNYCEIQGLSPEKRQEVQRRYERWKRLSDAERQEARLRWHASREPKPAPPVLPAEGERAAPLLPVESVTASAD